VNDNWTFVQNSSSGAIYQLHQLPHPSRVLGDSLIRPCVVLKLNNLSLSVSFLPAATTEHFQSNKTKKKKKVEKERLACYFEIRQIELSRGDSKLFVINFRRHHYFEVACVGGLFFVFFRPITGTFDLFVRDQLVCF
jgi:hypothetical protein